MQASPATSAQDSTSPLGIAPLWRSSARSFAARRTSRATIATYSSAALLVADSVAAQGMPTDAAFKRLPRFRE